jgi:hypothetical protein
MLKFAQKLTAQKPQSFAECWQAADEEGRYWLDERAAILEYEGRFTREEAETKAALDFHQCKESEAL